MHLYMLVHPVRCQRAQARTILIYATGPSFSIAIPSSWNHLFSFSLSPSPLFLSSSPLLLSLDLEDTLLRQIRMLTSAPDTRAFYDLLLVIALSWVASSLVITSTIVPTCPNSGDQNASYVIPSLSIIGKFIAKGTAVYVMRDSFAVA